MDDRLMRLEEAERTTGLSRSSIYRKMDEGTFPRSVRVTSGAVRWRMSQIMDWMESLPVTGGESAGDGSSDSHGQRPWSRRRRSRTEHGVRHGRDAYRGLTASGGTEAANRDFSLPPLDRPCSIDAAREAHAGVRIRCPRTAQ